MSIDEIDPSGLVTIVFSEKVLPIPSYLNYSILSEPGLVFNVTYILNSGLDADIDDVSALEHVPILQGWNVTNFTESYMTIQLNFTNKLWVSSGRFQDQLNIDVL